MPSTTPTGQDFCNNGDMALTLRHPRVSEVPDAEVIRAWARYLHETRRADTEDYPAIEERAWRRLVMSLDALGAPLELTRTPDA